MKKLPLAILILSGLCLCSCTYESEPPKTGNSSTVYVLPKGEVPTTAEREEVAAAKEEYANYIKQ